MDHASAAKGLDVYREAIAGSNRLQACSLARPVLGPITSCACQHGVCCEGEAAGARGRLSPTAPASLSSSACHSPSVTFFYTLALTKGGRL